MDEQRLVEVSEIVDAICNGNFKKGDLENLFIKIREEPEIGPIIRELGDFIAHREKNKGEIAEAAFVFSNFFMLFARTHLVGQGIDLAQEKFPFSFKNSLLSTLDNLSEKEVKDKCKITKDHLGSLIKKRFKTINKDTKEVKLDLDDLFQNFQKNKKLINSIISGINLLMSYLHVKEVFGQKLIIDELTTYLESYIDAFRKDDFIRQEQKIMLCILLIPHCAKIDNGSDSPGYCYVGAPLTDNRRDEKGWIIDDGTQKLKLFFSQSVQGNAPIAREIFRTDLTLNDWVEKSLFESGAKRTDLYWAIPMRLSDNFKLEVAKPKNQTT